MAIEFSRTSYAVWEITLKCNLACIHCGSRAGDARTDELSLTEALDLVAQMADLGIKEVTLIGGEAFMRHDWLEIVAEIDRRGMWCSITTGGLGISLAMAQQMKAAGIKSASVSIDGLEKVHDHLRGKPGSWQAAFQTMQHFREVGISFGCNTQINRLSAPQLPQIYDLIKNAGVLAWQIQMTVPMGNAADREEILLQPYELLDLYPMLARIARRSITDGIHIRPGNNIGYYGPFERLIRGRNEELGFWTGCAAGLVTIGIEADGKIKADPSLPSEVYTGGNIRDRSLRDIVEHAPELNFNQHLGTPQATEHLWGFCKTCEYAEICRGGCSWTAHVFFDRRGNNPYCHHRALVQAEQGIRERFYQEVPAGGLPFDNGKFVVVEESFADPLNDQQHLRFTKDKIQWPANWPADQDYNRGNLYDEQSTTTAAREPVSASP